MATDVLMPPLSQTGDSLVLTEWLKQVGETVTKGEPLFLVESDKATLEIEAPATGVLASILVAAGTEAPVRSRLAVIAAPEEQLPVLPSEANATIRSAVQETASADLHPPERIPLPAERVGRIAASPRARRLAIAEGVDLKSVAASGAQGMIVERDVMAAVRARPRLTPVAARAAASLEVDVGQLPTSPGERIRRKDVVAAVATLVAADTATAPERPAERQPHPLDPVRATIARRLQASQRNAVAVTLTREVDATALVALRTQLLEAWPADAPRLTITDLLMVIAARCLVRHPHLNGTFDGQLVTDDGPVDLALAVDTPRGLVTPVLRACERRDLAGVARERQNLVERALANRLTHAELEGGSFTLSNMGALGIDAFTPVLNPPQIAIMGVGRIRPVVAVLEGAPVVRQSMILSLTFDHRVVDGAPAARFLGDIAALIAEPHRIWLHLAVE